MERVTGDLWVPGAERLTPAGAPGQMLHDAPARVVWHTTEAPSGNSPAGRPYFDLMAQILVRKKFEPHLLYDPSTDRLGQFFALDTSARALENDDAAGIKTNRTGEACIQIEVVAYAAKPFTDYWTPGPNFRALMAAIRSWGIPDDWPISQMSKAGEAVSRDAGTWRSRGGHYGHCHIPGNAHWDCGAINHAALFAAAQEDDLDANQAHMLQVVYDTLTAGVTGQKNDGEVYAMVKSAQADARAAVDATTPGKEGVKYDGTTYAQLKAAASALAYLTKAVDGQPFTDGTLSKLAAVLSGVAAVNAGIDMGALSTQLATALTPHLQSASTGLSADAITAAVRAGLSDLTFSAKGA